MCPNILIREAELSAAIGLRQDFDAATLRRLATTVKDADQVRRLLALASVYDGQSREEAARIGGMDRQTLRDWVLRFNELALSLSETTVSAALIALSTAPRRS